MSREPVVDHVATTWSDLDRAERIFADLGMEPEYGGEHADSGTEMSMVCFQDGSYLEFVSGLEDADRPGRWPEGIAHDAGPYAWATEVGSVLGHLSRAMEMGHPVAGPFEAHRDPPEGHRTEFDYGWVGTRETRGLLPFPIDDRTPRRYRASPTRSVVRAPVSGVGAVLLAVESLDRTEIFREFYHFPTADRRHDRDRGIEVASFPGRTVTLVAPADDAGADPAEAPERRPDYGPTGEWLRARLDAHGERICGVLLRTGDPSAVQHRFPLAERERWCRGSISWVEDDRVGRWLGVVEPGD